MNFFKIKNFIVLLALFVVPSLTNAALTISPLKHELIVDQGTSKVEKIKIINKNPNAITLYTSKEDFISGDDTGQPKFVKAEEQTHPELSLANWITLTEENITLAPNETREISFKVDVPKNGEPGGHYGAIFFAPEATAGQISIIQRLGVLVLVDVPGEVKIDGEFKEVEIGTIGEDKKLQKTNNVKEMPVVFSTLFQNKGNVHLKPKGKIEIIDESGAIIKNVGKEPIVSPAGAFMGEKMVDYIPLNAEDGNVLPNSERRYNTNWEGIAYQILDENTGVKNIEFRSLTDYYAKEIADKATNLKFWEQIKSKKVKKPFTANVYAYFEGKDKQKEEFRTNKEFFVTYTETYVGLNMVLVGIVAFILIAIVLYFFVMAPKNKTKKEEEMRKKIMEEMKNNNN